MATSTITGATTKAFICLRGAVPLYPGEEVEDVSRPGKDGVAARRRGKRGDLFTLLGVRDHTSAANANTFNKELKALEGTIVALEDDHAISYANVLLIKADTILFKKVAIASGGVSGGTVTHVTYHRITMRLAAASY